LDRLDTWKTRGTLTTLFFLKQLAVLLELLASLVKSAKQQHPCWNVYRYKVPDKQKLDSCEKYGEICGEMRSFSPTTHELQNWKKAYKEVSQCNYAGHDIYHDCFFPFHVCRPIYTYTKLLFFDSLRRVWEMTDRQQYSYL
jgi:hypothetical protein